ncbi:Phophatidylserine decarboxylase-domain-containing protein [Boletus coccyginus]|nr:Phophatidylserine decarboxylase-domain-containing protein [Boletus coccyginus]
MPYKLQNKGTIARWLPKDPAILWKYHHDLLRGLSRDGVLLSSGDVDEKQLSLVILEFKQVIEEDAEIFRDFHEMFDQVAPNPNPDQDPIKDYKQLLALLDKTIASAPQFIYDSPLITGVPMYGIIGFFCNTEAGYRAFTNRKVNVMFHKLFDEWSRFLVSPDSRHVLTNEETGWFGEKALQAQAERLGEPFERVWVCNPQKPNWGFTSWDDFFVRRFQDGKRPTVNPYDPRIINAACEAITFRVLGDVQATDTFWIKEQPYSLQHILNYTPIASQLNGGTVFQAMLSSLDYHRWHSPVDGRVVRTEVVPGTYYAALVDDDKKDIDVISRSQSFVTSMCARALIFIESDNPDIGLMCFVGVGLGEVSTTKIEVEAGDRIKKGDEIGSFRFGGSTHLLVFRPETKLTLLPGPEDEDVEAKGDAPKKPRLVGSMLFVVEN